MGRITINKANKSTKQCFIKIKYYSSFKKTSISQLNNIVRKLNYTVLSDNFTTFLNKSIKQVSSTVPNVKGFSQSQTLVKSKSQEVISSSKSLVSSGENTSIQLSP